MKRIKHFRTAATELSAILKDSLCVRHIRSELDYRDHDYEARTLRDYMEGQHFDVMGVRTNGVVRGYVRVHDLSEGPCGLKQHAIGSHDLVQDATPLVDMLPLMAKKERVFVGHDSHVTGIVTRADLQKAPVRLLLFGFVTVLEMYMLQMVRICCPDNRLPLADKRLNDARRLLARRTSENTDIDLADCLQFCDKRTVFLAREGFATFWGFTDDDVKCDYRNPKRCLVPKTPLCPSGRRLAVCRFFMGAERLRNALAHAQDLVAEDTWPEIIATAVQVEGFLKKCETNMERFEKHCATHVSGL